MIRKDNLRIERVVYETIEGEAVNHKNIVIKENIPCHLSGSVTNTVIIDATPYIVSEFTLFMDFDSEIDIKENDILFVETSKNQKYKLTAGEVKIYDSSVQVKCRQKKIIES